MLPTIRGVLFLLLTAPLLAAATWSSSLQWVAGVYALLIIGLMLLDWRLAGPVEAFDLERHHDSKLSLGAENRILLSLRHHQRRPVTFWLRDEPPDAFDIDMRLLTGTAKPRELWEGAYHVRPLRRGDYQFGNINVRWRGPLRFMVRQGVMKTAVSVKVYPNLLNVRQYDLLLRRNRLQELGLRHARLFGEGTEFDRLREYQPDDEFRRINWKATARRNRPVTTEYQVERSQNIIAVLDTGRMMQSPVANIAKLDYAINAVLFLAYVASGKGDKVGMMTFADNVGQFLGPRQGRGQFYRMLEMLYAVEPQPVEPDYQRALSYLALKQRKRSLIIIFTDLSSGASIDTLISSVSVLARRSLPLVVTISDPDIHTAAQQQPQTSLDVYQRAAAAQLLDERRVALENLQRRGVLTLDVPANQLSIAVINRYLELKGKMRL